MDEPTGPSTLEAPATPTEAVSTAMTPSIPVCGHCRREMPAEQNFCATCGWDRARDEMPKRRPRMPARDATPHSDKKRLTALLLCTILGSLGLHRFYVGRNLSGVLFLVTLGGFIVGGVFDVIMISTGEFRDAEGRLVADW